MTSFPGQKTNFHDRHKALGSDVKVTFKNKGPAHSMKNPNPALEFIRKHSHLK